MMQRRVIEPLHIINPMTDIGGSELHAADMYRVLSRHAPTTLWTEREPHAELAARVPIRRIRLARWQFPKHGVFLFVGAYFSIGRWWHWARPERTLLLYNIVNRPRLERTLARLTMNGRREVEMIYASENLKADAGRPGIVEDSPIDLQTFAPARERTDTEFVVGRASRDDPLKFAPDDPALFEQLADAGFRVRIAGGTCLASRVAAHPRIELLGMRSPLALPRFMQGLDCFVYRTSPEWPEAYGRVVAEAMACGVPPIVTSTAGIAAHIKHGVNGFIADANADVMNILLRLRDEPALRKRIGAAARAAMERRYGEAQLAAIAAHYLRRPAHTVSPEVCA